MITVASFESLNCSRAPGVYILDISNSTTLNYWYRYLRCGARKDVLQQHAELAKPASRIEIKLFVSGVTFLFWPQDRC